VDCVAVRHCALLYITRQTDDFVEGHVRFVRCSILTELIDLNFTFNRILD
jgi:hypothetical protein